LLKNFTELKYNSLLDLLNEEGEQLYSIYGDSKYVGIGRIVHVDREDKIYTLKDDPFPHVRRYEVIINKK
jgi:hypothetical protein